MVFSIEFRPGVLKNMKSFSKRDLIRVKKKIDDLTTDLPAPPTTIIKGNNPFHKVRSGDFRIIYEIHENKLVILVVKIGHRKDVYKNLP